MAQFTQKLLICLVGSIQMRILCWAYWYTLVFINFCKETIATVLKFNDLFWFKFLHVVLVTGFLLGMITLIEHI